MQRVYLLFARAWLLVLIGVIAFLLLVDRKPMAVNVVNLLQNIPDNLMDTVRHNDHLDERKAWDAVHYYEDRLLLSPGDIGAITSLGYIFIELKAYSKAFLMYQKALKMDPHLFGLRYDLAYIQYKMGNSQAAYQLLSESLKQNFVARDDCLCLLGAESLDENNARRIMAKISLIVMIGQKAPLDKLNGLFNGFFDDGLFYYAFLREYTVNGKSGIVLF